MSKRAVLYARVSKDDTKQERRNLDSQIELGEEYATEKGYTIIERLTEDDKGAKGDDINLPQLNRVREMANNKELDVLIVREIDRLSRSLAKQLIVEEEMKRSGVQIDYVLGDYPDTPEGNFMRHIRATVSEYEREKINERVVRGRYNKVKAGSVFVSGSAPFGYDLKQDERGNYYFEINESEAKTVRQIYEWYLSGLAIRKIAQRLSDNQTPSWADNRPGKKGIVGKKQKYGKWSQGSVRHILTKETYAGVWHYGKRIGRGTKLRPKDQQVGVSVPAIVSREVWDTVAALREKRKTVRKHEGTYDYLLKGMGECNHCGYRIGTTTAHVGGKTYPYYRCNARRKELVRQCDHSSVHYKAMLVDDIVWSWIVSLLTDPELLEQGLETFFLEKEQNVEPIFERLEITRKLIDEEIEKLDRLLELYLSGEFEKELLTERKTRSEAKIAALLKEELELQSIVNDQSVTRDQIDSIKAFGQQIAEELTITPSPEMKKYILNSLEIQAYFGETEGKERFVRVQCALGNDFLSLMNTTTSGPWGRRERHFYTFVPTNSI